MLSKGVLMKKHTYVLANVWKKETEKKKKELCGSDLRKQTDTTEPLTADWGCSRGWSPGKEN